MKAGLSIRSRIAFFLVLPLALTLGLGAFAIVMHLRGELLAGLQAESEYHAGAVAATFRNDVLERHRALVSAIADFAEVRSGDPESLAEMFRRMEFVLGGLASAGFGWNRNDGLRAVVYEDGPTPDPAALERVVQQTAGHDVDTLRAQLVCLPATDGQPLLVALAPYRDNAGRLLGVLGTVLSPRQLSAQIGTRIRSGAVYLVNEDGDIIVGTSAGPEDAKLREWVAALTAAQRSGRESMPAAPGYVASAATVSEPGLAFLFFAPQHEVFSLSMTVTTQLTALMGALVAIAAVLMLLMARTVVRPLRRTRARILEHAHRFIPEDTRDLIPHIRDEARQLEVLFDRVADEVAAREDAIQQSEHRYRTLTETLTDAVFILDDRLRIRYANRRFSEWTGYDGDIEGSPSLDAFVLPEHRERLRLALQGVLATGTSVHDVEVQIPPAVGQTEPRVLRVEAVPYGRDGATVGSLLVVARDVTLQAQLQAQLLQSEKMSALGQLVSGVAHEINNPLTTILAAAQSAQLDAAGGPTVEALERIVEETRRVSRIVRNLLTFARQHPLSRQATDVNSVVEAVCAMRRYDIESGGCALVQHLDGSRPIVSADPYQLEQVLLNLVNNAAQAIRDAERNAGRIDITTARQGDQVLVTVSDNGPGVAEGLRDRIFDPFFTTKASGQGTGLGLSVSLAIVREHQGQLTVRPNPTGGAVFTVALPGAPAEPDQRTRSQRRGPTPLPHFPGRRVLVIDDEEGVRRALVESLGRLEVEAHAVGDASLALADPELARYDLILCDLRMPGLDGRAFHAALLETAPERVDRLVIVTGDAVSPETARFLKSTGLPTLLKPFELADLAQVLKRRL